MPLIPDFEQEFLAFAREKPRDEEYNAANCCVCALAQFVYSKLPEADCYPTFFFDADGEQTQTYPIRVLRAAVYFSTWGGLVDRLQEL